MRVTRRRLGARLRVSRLTLHCAHLEPDSERVGQRGLHASPFLSGRCSVVAVFSSSGSSLFRPSVLSLSLSPGARKSANVKKAIPVDVSNVVAIAGGAFEEGTKGGAVGRRPTGFQEVGWSGLRSRLRLPRELLCVVQASVAVDVVVAIVTRGLCVFKTPP